jgi:16S rRNA (cytosine1402-N4)-methyltransferase
MMADRGGAKAIGILLDLGLRSSQVDRPERGFSYLEDGPLDMRMEEGTGPTAERLLSEADRPTLVRVLREGGEEPRAPRIARGILEARERGGLATTRDLARAVEAAVPRRDRIRSLARTFQAVRIWVNRELEELDAFLAEAPEMLEEEGVLCVISYHSLEDRRVKRAMRGWARGCICPPQAPECRCGRSPEVELLTRRVKVPSAGEKARNPRSRSAKLRACRRIRGGGDEKR